MRGHVDKREGKRGTSWYYIVDVGRDEATGKRNQKMKRGFRTRKEAESAMRKVISALEDGTYVLPSRKTLAQYFEEWKDDYVTHNVRESTAAEYIRIIDRYIVPHLGHHRIQNLRPQHIQSYISLMLKSGRVRGKGGLSPATVKRHFRVLSAALKHAVNMDIIKANPADRVELPKVKKYKPQVVNAEMVALILEQAVGTPWLAAFCLAFYTGIRRSELCGLRWSDVDIDEYCLTIDRARVAVRGGSVEGEPKSETSSRLISLSTNVAYVLYYHLRDQQRMFKALGMPWTEECHMFCNDRGRPYNPSSITHAFKRVARKAGFPDVRLHDARHAHATILMDADVHLTVVQERLGHSTITITSDTYSHVMREMDVDAAEAFERKFDKFG